MFQWVRNIQVITQTPLSDSAGVMELYSNTDVFVKLKVIVFKVAERDQWNNVIGAREPGMLNSSSPF